MISISTQRVKSKNVYFKNTADRYLQSLAIEPRPAVINNCVQKSPGREVLKDFYGLAIKILFINQLKIRFDLLMYVMLTVIHLNFKRSLLIYGDDISHKFRVGDATNLAFPSR